MTQRTGVAFSASAMVFRRLVIALVVLTEFQEFLAFRKWGMPKQVLTRFLGNDFIYSLPCSSHSKRQLQGLASRFRIRNRLHGKPGSCFHEGKSSKKHAATKSCQPWENRVGKCNCHQWVEEYGKPGKGNCPQMLAGFCRFNCHQAGAAADHKLQEYGIVICRRPEENCAY